MCGSVRASVKSLHEAEIYQSQLQWKPQNVRDARTMGHLSRKSHMWNVACVREGEFECYT